MKWVRIFLGIFMACVACHSMHSTSPNNNENIPITGERVPELAGLDSMMVAFLNKYRIPGGALGLAKDGRLIFARGYGLADLEAGIPVMPEALFRIASVSKPFTAVGILKLVEEGKLNLDDHPFVLCSDIKPLKGEKADPRIDQITVLQLLSHTGGWDRERGYDPMFQSVAIAHVMNTEAPASARTIMSYMMRQKLDNEPGTQFAYSNFGYSVLGRTIEHVTDRSYEDYMQTEVFLPMGIARMKIGHTRLVEQANGEVKYYTPGHGLGYPMVSGVFFGEGLLPSMYGGFYLESMDAHGGWIASTIDLLRFATAVDGLNTRLDFLQKATVDLMVAKPPGVFSGSGTYYALGWFITPSGEDANWWHDGYLPGTSALLVRSHLGVIWAVLFNAQIGQQEMSEVDRGIWREVRNVNQWPSNDRFGDFP